MISLGQFAQDVFSFYSEWVKTKVNLWPSKYLYRIKVLELSLKFSQVDQYWQFFFWWAFSKAGSSVRGLTAGVILDKMVWQK